MPLACAGFSGKREENPFRLGLWPLYTSDSRSWAGMQESRGLGPFLHWEQNGELDLFETRPLFSSTRAKRSRRWDLLYPLAARRVDPERKQSWLLLLARSRTDAPQNTTQAQVGVGFSGRTEEGKRYGGVFPLWGFFLERFGFDRISFVLWPLFARGHRGGYTETQILWPIFKYGRGDGRRLFRIWPFFGRKTREGAYKKTFYLWPIFFSNHERLSSRYPRHTFFMLPLYGRRDAGPFSSRFYLLPLYMKQWDRRKPEVRRLDLLWPVYTRARDAEGKELFAVRPFYSRTRSESERTTSLLFASWLRTERDAEGVEERFSRWLWASRAGTRREQGVETKQFDFWPFYRSRSVREADGSAHGFVRVPYLLPMRGLEPDGWDRHYNKLFELYGARWRDEERRSSLLFGLREVRRAPDLVWESWGGWVQFRRRPGG